MSHHTKAQFSPQAEEKSGQKENHSKLPMGQTVRHSPKDRRPEKPLIPTERPQPQLTQGGCHGHGTLFPETTPYLLVRYAQARRGPCSRLVIAGILAIVLHLRLGQAAAQGTHPISPAKVGEDKLDLSTLPRAPSPVPVPQDRRVMGGARKTESLPLHCSEWLPSHKLERNSVIQDLVNAGKEKL